jgi:hypothetical protein
MRMPDSGADGLGQDRASAGVAYECVGFGTEGFTLIAVKAPIVNASLTRLVCIWSFMHRPTRNYQGRNFNWAGPRSMALLLLSKNIRIAP